MVNLNGDRLREARLDAGLSQVKLAAAIGASPPLIGRWERGDSQPTTEHLQQLAFALDVDVASLLRRRPEPTTSLANLRQDAGLSEGVVAAAAGVGILVYRQLEHGWFHDDILVHKVAVVLGVPAEVIQAAIDNA